MQAYPGEGGGDACVSHLSPWTGSFIASLAFSAPETPTGGETTVNLVMSSPRSGTLQLFVQGLVHMGLTGGTRRTAGSPQALSDHPKGGCPGAVHMCEGEWASEGWRNHVLNLCLPLHSQSFPWKKSSYRHWVNENTCFLAPKWRLQFSVVTHFLLPYLSPLTVKPCVTTCASGAVWLLQAITSLEQKTEFSALLSKSQLLLVMLVICRLPTLPESGSGIGRGANPVDCQSCAAAPGRLDFLPPTQLTFLWGTGHTQSFLLLQALYTGGVPDVLLYLFLPSLEPWAHSLQWPLFSTGLFGSVILKGAHVTLLSDSPLAPVPWELGPMAMPIKHDCPVDSWSPLFWGAVPQPMFLSFFIWVLIKLTLTLHLPSCSSTLGAKI